MNTKEKLYLIKQAGPWSEYIGRGTSVVIPALLGAGVGGAHAGAPGALVGGVGSASISPALASVLALLTKTRTKEEQEAADNDSSAWVKNLLIPGHAQYQHYKRKGYLADAVGHPLSDV